MQTKDRHHAAGDASQQVSICEPEDGVDDHSLSLNDHKIHSNNLSSHHQQYFASSQLVQQY
jgi:hypothetical protein